MTQTTNDINLNNVFKKLGIVLLLSLIIIYFWGQVLFPFIVAFLTAYLFEPFVLKCNLKYKINRNILAGLISFVFLILIICTIIFVIPGMFFEFNLIVSKIPSIINYINNDLISYVNLHFHTKLSNDLIFIDQNLYSYKEFLKSHPQIIQKVTISGLHVFEKLIFICLFPIILFFSIKNYEILIGYFSRIFSNEQKNFLKPIISDVLTSLSKYIRGQAIVIFIMTIYYITITLFLNGSIFIGLISGILLFVPWLGILTGITLSIIYSLGGTGDLAISSIFIIYGIGYMLEHWLVLPYFIGNSLGIHPIIIILCIFVLGYSFGIVGIVLSLPLTAIFSVLIKHSYNLYVNSIQNPKK